MNNTPEDSTLRRHYLTEQKYKALREQQVAADTIEYSNRFTIYVTAAFIFLLAVLFL